MMHIKKTAGAATLLLVIVTVGAAGCSRSDPEPSSPEPPRVMTAVDMVELRRLRDPLFSPGGKQVLYRRSEVIWGENKEVDDYRLVDLNTGAPQTILGGRKKDEYKKAIWTGDGEGIVVLADKDGASSDHDQAYFYDIGTQRLTRLTDHGADIKNMVWAPDREGFYFRSRQARSEQMDRDLDDDWTIREYETRQLHELWFFDWQTQETKKLLGGDFDVRGFSVSRDGKKILYVNAANALLDRQDSEIWLYDVESELAERFTHNAYAESKPVLSPDNASVAYIATVNENGEPYYEDNLFVQRIGQTESRLLLSDTAMEIVDINWDSDGSGLYLLGNTGVRTQLYRVDLQTEALTAMTAGDHVIDAWSYDAELNVHTFKKVSEENPGEVWVLDLDGADARQVSSEYAELSTTFRLPQQSTFTWQGRDGETIEGLLIHPLNYEAGVRFPLVTIVHGGPRSSAQFGSWNMSRYVPVLAGQGYGVFLPNHRGGTGYGDEFMRDMVGQYFNNAHHDVLTGIDALVEQQLADPDALIMMGWSAGGHMTNKLVTTTDRFQAASSGAGVSDWTSLYGESDVRHNRTPWFGGAPWQEDAPLDNYMAQSLLADAWRVKTPTLFLVGEKDVRVPPTQTIMMYRGVKAAGTETELYVAPGQPHGYEDPTFRLFKMNKELEWYARHLGRPAYEAVYPEARISEDE